MGCVYRGYVMPYTNLQQIFTIIFYVIYIIESIFGSTNKI